MSRLYRREKSCGLCAATFVSKARLTRFCEGWREFGSFAGAMRNGEMAAVGHAAVVFWDGESRGAANMATRMLSLRKRVSVVLCEPIKKRSAQGMLL